MALEKDYGHPCRLGGRLLTKMANTGAVLSKKKQAAGPGIPGGKIHVPAELFPLS